MDVAVRRPGKGREQERKLEGANYCYLVVSPVFHSHGKSLLRIFFGGR